MAHHHGSGDGLEAGYYLRDTHKMEEMVDGCSDPSGSVPGQREAATAATSGRFIQGEQVSYEISSDKTHANFCPNRKSLSNKKGEALVYTSRAGQSSSDRAIQCRLLTTTLGGFVQGSLSGTIALEHGTAIIPPNASSPYRVINYGHTGRPRTG